jgi:hypothetical protein
MAITIKLGDLVNVVEAKALSALANMPGLSAKAVYDVTKLVKKVAPEHEGFIAARNALIKKHGTGEPGKESIAAGTDAMRDFVAELNQLAEQEVELPISRVVLPAGRGDEPCGLTAAQILMLEPMIDIPGVTDAAEEAKDGDAKKQRKEAAKS